MTPAKHIDYDVAAPDIRCNADKAGARVWELPSNLWRKGYIRVLAHEETEAKEIAETYEEE